ncbi:hypothetical protein DPMN_013676 [Dreissena polymorpha]|uniref:Uncharacterized protein n=1 Tax=Dreissena polymorpha TaxID=45954 RepID=A0A9D4NA93_DREPO|nr:hypothetical protein DPMN_013676 [Dreissena polymorpha]
MSTGLNLWVAEKKLCQTKSRPGNLPLALIKGPIKNDLAPLQWILEQVILKKNAWILV